jgi:2-polyprenyl-3-methyl-5-hydroxy-6-metoxy-1,4-benzoquinol methylase
MGVLKAQLDQQRRLSLYVRPALGILVFLSQLGLESPSDLDQTASEHTADSERFAFGENWRNFLERVDDDRISEAERSLKQMLGVSILQGLTFLDIGCGSGLFSLAAARMGAEAVRSFDFDPDSVQCAKILRDRVPNVAWTIEQGSALDDDYIGSLGQFDVVYSWGVLHHTGDMARAMENAAKVVAPGGRLFISIYNDQGRRSRRWRRIKHTYNQLPSAARAPFACLVMAPIELRSALNTSLRSGPRTYVARWTQYKRNRGMSRWHDIIDWVGGYPFEVARPEEVFDFFRQRGFVLERLGTCGGSGGCNEFVFTRPTA